MLFVRLTWFMGEALGVGRALEVTPGGSYNVWAFSTVGPHWELA